MPKTKIAPSILSADRKNLNKDVAKIEDYADLIHVDIMDGTFVPPTTFHSSEIKAVKTNLPKDVHLMVSYPKADGWIDSFIDAGAAIITIHEECKEPIVETLEYIKSQGVKTGISINPPTPLDNITKYLDFVDMVLIMSVNPGYAGQAFVPEVLDKVKKLRALKPDMDIEIDGGIGLDTIGQAKEAGANVFVAGSAVFGKDDPKQAVIELRQAAK